MFCELGLGQLKSQHWGQLAVYGQPQGAEHNWSFCGRRSKDRTRWSDLSYAIVA